MDEAYRYLDNLLDAARLKGASSHVEIGGFRDALTTAPQADLDLFGLSDNPDLEELHSYVDLTGSSSVFVADSGNENV